MQLQSLLLTLLPLVLPLITPLVGSSVAAIISQRGWPNWFNESIACFCLLGFAALDMGVNGLFTKDGLTVVIVADAINTITLLSSGQLVKPGPWLKWITWLQNNVFDVVSRPESSAPVHAPEPKTSTTKPTDTPTAVTSPKDPPVLIG